MPSYALDKTKSPNPHVKQLDPKCFFLTLPFSIRRQIYSEIRPKEGQCIDMNFFGSIRKPLGSEIVESMPSLYRSMYETREERRLRHDYNRTREEWPPLPLSLLYTCHTIHDELENIIYSSYRFMISRQYPHGLQALENMSISAIQNLERITIRLNLENDHICRGAKPVYRCKPDDNDSLPGKELFDGPLRSESIAGRQLISEWTRTCSRLSKTTPNQLALYIICDCADLDTARAILHPLKSLPALRDCAIRLAEKYHQEWQPLIEKTVWQLMGDGIKPPQTPTTPFRFLDLPKEIQLHILSFTHLVRRNYEMVICTPQGFDLERKVWRGDYPYDWEIKIDEWSFCKQWWTHGMGTSCFCKLSHAAFTSRCKCEYNPSCYFLINREFGEAAKRVFYSSNQFRIQGEGVVSSYPDPGTKHWKEEEVVAPLPFLEWFPRDCIKYLTYLTLEMHELKPRHGLLCRGGWKQWRNSIDLLYKEANLPVLTLEFRMDEPFWYADWTTPGGPYYDTLPRPPENVPKRRLELVRNERMGTIYRPLFEPMAKLHNLKDVFINLGWKTSEIVCRPDGRKIREQALERLIKGDDYNAWRRKKPVCLCGWEIEGGISGRWFEDAPWEETER